MKVSVAAEERCEICAAPIAQEHNHLVDVRDRRLLCACRACHLLFEPEGAAQGRYRPVGDRCVQLDPETFAGPRWEALQIPIGLAFFFYTSALQRIIGFYPGPAGATESQLSLAAWEDLARDEPRLSTLRPDIEATLVYRRKDGGVQAYIVPIDLCYELVGIVRTSWQGFEGGDAARELIDSFFARVRERCT